MPCRVRLRVLAFLLVLSAAALAAPALKADIIYVDASATGLDDGTSWEDAFTDLQNGLDAATGAGDQIWVATGTYHPSVEVGGTGERYRSFSLRNGVALYGGFAGGEEALDERDPELHPTTLSGDIGVPDDASDNCYHVFHHPDGSNLDETAVLDGFIVTAGRADGSGGDSHRGGGMYNEDASPTIANCVFLANRASAAYSSDGGAVCNYYASPRFESCAFVDNLCGQYGGAIANLWFASPVIVDCTFSGNHAGLDGSANGFAGAMYCYGTCDPLVSGCTFEQNSANYDGGAVGHDGSAGAYYVNCRFSGNVAVLYGGAAYNRGGATSTYVQCIFDQNQGTAANAHGGAMYNYNASPTIGNCVLYGNESGCVGDGIYNYQYSDPVITNCIILGADGIYSGGGSEPTVTYCAIEQGGFEDPEWHNIAADPLLADPAGGDYHLTEGSPCIDAGSNDALPSDAADIDGDEDIAEPIPLDYFADERRQDVPGVPDTGQGAAPIVDIGIHEYSDTEVAVPSTPGTPEEAALHPNRPNPFNPRTTISYATAEPASVTLRVFDTAGRLVDVLVEAETMPAGTHTATWTGRDARGRAMPSGIYFCRLETGGQVETRRMALIR